MLPFGMVAWRESYRTRVVNQAANAAVKAPRTFDNPSPGIHHQHGRSYSLAEWTWTAERGEPEV